MSPGHLSVPGRSDADPAGFTTLQVILTHTFARRSMSLALELRLENAQDAGDFLHHNTLIATTLLTATFLAAATLVAAALLAATTLRTATLLAAAVLVTPTTLIAATMLIAATTLITTTVFITATTLVAAAVITGISTPCVCTWSDTVFEAFDVETRLVGSGHGG